MNMRLGSIVGIVFSLILIIAGVVMCVNGTSMAKDTGDQLFTQISDGGTYYIQKIGDGTTRLDIEFDNADITIIGGAERSQIEFYNFNPNFYSLTSTPNVISFEETQNIKSVVEVWENGINFKGLRYALDFKSYEYESDKKSIVISLSSDIGMKIIDINANSGTVKIEKLSLDGDVSLKLNEGKVNIDNVNTTSIIEISGEKVDASITDSKVLSLRHTVKESNIRIDGCTLTNTEITVDSGRVDYICSEPIGDTLLNVSSESGGLMVNAVPHSGPLISETDESDDPKDPEDNKDPADTDSPNKSLKIKCVAAGINLEYPEDTSAGETSANDKK